MLGVPELAAMVAGAAAIAGHWKSIFTGFKGGDGMVVLVGVSLVYLSWYILIGIAVGIVTVLLFRRSVFRSSIGIFLGYGAMLALNPMHGENWAVMFGLTALAMVVVTHNILTTRITDPTRWRRSIPTFSSKTRPEVLGEAARLSEEAILLDVLPPDDESESKRPT